MSTSHSGPHTQYSSSRPKVGVRKIDVSDTGLGTGHDVHSGGWSKGWEPDYPKNYCSRKISFVPRLSCYPIRLRSRDHRPGSPQSPQTSVSWSLPLLRGFVSLPLNHPCTPPVPNRPLSQYFSFRTNIKSKFVVFSTNDPTGKIFKQAYSEPVWRP